MAAEGAKTEAADLQLVVDLRESEKGWSANVCGLSVAVRALMTARHAGVKEVVLVGPQAEKFKAAAMAHPYNALSITCAEEIPEAGAGPRMIFSSPLVLSSDAIKSLAPDASPEGLRLPSAELAAELDYLVPANDARGRRLAGSKIRKSCRKPVEYSGIMSVLFKQSIVLQMTRWSPGCPSLPTR